jgi:hypothetical protein
VNILQFATCAKKSVRLRGADTNVEAPGKASGWVAPFWDTGPEQEPAEEPEPDDEDDDETLGFESSSPVQRIVKDESGIDFRGLHKLREPYVVEGIVEVYARLHGETESALLRLEALRSVANTGYEVAVYRRQTIPLVDSAQSADAPARRPASGDVWVAYDLIHSSLATSYKALGQVLRFMEMRCR